MTLSVARNPLYMPCISRTMVRAFYSVRKSSNTIKQEAKSYTHIARTTNPDLFDMAPVHKPEKENVQPEVSASNSATLRKTWIHIPTRLTLAWLHISIPLVIWVCHQSPIQFTLLIGELGYWICVTSTTEYAGRLLALATMGSLPNIHANGFGIRLESNQREEWIHRRTRIYEYTRNSPIRLLSLYRLYQIQIYWCGSKTGNFWLHIYPWPPWCTGSYGWIYSSYHDI